MGMIFSRQKTMKQKIEAVLFSAGVQALLLFRLSHLLNQYKLARMLRLHTFLYRLNQFICHVDIDPNVKIGTNFLMPHPSGIVIGGTAVIGNNCIMMQNSTIGARNLGEVSKRHATLADSVFVGPNAVILGNITIGKNARIGAGSIVLADVNEDQTIIGVHSGHGKLLR
jgi:serine O-acetyltransferase